MDVYIDSLLMDMELDERLQSAEYVLNSDDPLADQLESVENWKSQKQVERFHLTINTTPRSISLRVSRNA